MFRYSKLTALREAALWLLAIVFLVPFYFLITTALKTDTEALTGSTLAPPQARS